MNEANDHRPTRYSFVQDDRLFIRRVAITVLMATIAFVALFITWHASNILLAVFAGGLVAVLLHSISRWIQKRTGLSQRVALFATLLAIVVIILLASTLTAPAIADQARRLRPALMEALATLEGQVSDLSLGGAQDGSTSLVEQFMSVGSALFGRFSTIFSTAAGVVANFVVILFVGIYFAYEPQTYVDGFLHLVPKKRRAAIRDVIQESYYTLQWWLAGRLAAMVILGALAVAGLLLLNIPLALVLGALVGLFEFIPYLGPILALVPALLVAFGQSSTQALYVLILYAVLQVVESYILTPIIEKRVVSLAPVLLISSQLIMGVLFGFWGLLLAPPLVVVARIVIKKLYVERALGDHSVTYLSEEHAEEDGGESGAN